MRCGFSECHAGEESISERVRPRSASGRRSRCTALPGLDAPHHRQQRRGRAAAARAAEQLGYRVKTSRSQRSEGAAEPIAGHACRKGVKTHGRTCRRQRRRADRETGRCRQARSRRTRSATRPRRGRGCGAKIVGHDHPFRRHRRRRWSDRCCGSDCEFALVDEAQAARSRSAGAAGS